VGGGREECEEKVSILKAVKWKALESDGGCPRRERGEEPKDKGLTGLNFRAKFPGEEVRPGERPAQVCWGGGGKNLFLKTRDGEIGGRGPERTKWKVLLSTQPDKGGGASEGKEQ